MTTVIDNLMQMFFWQISYEESEDQWLAWLLGNEIVYTGESCKDLNQ